MMDSNKKPEEDLRDLDDIIDDLGVVLKRLDSLDKRIKVVGVVTESAVHQVIQIEKELNGGVKKKKKPRKLFGRFRDKEETRY
jgi:hypothetical protein